MSMVDVIDTAITVAREQLNTSNITSTANRIISPINTQTVNASVQDLKGKLPVQKDPRLIAREAEANALEIKTTTERKLLNLKETTLERLKTTLNRLTLPTISFPPKLPLLNPKILQTSILAKQVKAAITLKQKLSRQNLKKASEVYEYPLSAVATTAPINSPLPITQSPSTR
jgi:hypothetical protein